MSNKDSASINMRVIVQERPLGPKDYPRLRSEVEGMLQEHTEWMLEGTERYGRLRDTEMSRREDELPTGSYLSRPFFLTGFQEHTRIVDGRWPEAGAVLHEDGVDMEAVIGLDAGERLRLGIDSKVYVYPFMSEPTQRITLKVVGLVEPLDDREDFWMGYPGYFDVVDVTEDRFSLPVYLREEDYLWGLGSRYPNLIGEYGWLGYFDFDVITAPVMERAEDSLAELEVGLNKGVPRTLVIAGLNNTLESYQRELTLAKVPLLLFLTMLVGAMLYFLFLAMGLLGRTRRDEASLMMSRGASGLQVWGLLLLSDGVLVLLAVVLGPLLALILGLAVVPELPSSIGGEQLNNPLSLSANMFLLSGAGAVVSFGLLIFSGSCAGRLGMVAHLNDRARPPSLPLLQRYYLDVVALGLIGLVWWQIYERGGFTARKLTGIGLEVEPSLLLGPMLAFAGIAILMLRVLPLAIRGASRVADRLGPIWLSFGLRRVARDPLPHAYLAVMLLLAGGLGTFATSVQETRSKSEEDRVLYSVGADVVVQARGTSLMEDRLAEIGEVKSFSPIYRDILQVRDKPGVGSAFLLAADSEMIENVSWFREDFADVTLGELATRIKPGKRANEGISIPGELRTLGLWARVDVPGIAPTITLRMRDARGRLGKLTMEKLDSQEWTYLEKETETWLGGLEAPLELYSISIKYVFAGGPKIGSVSIDDVTVTRVGAPDRREVVYSFEGASPWTAFPNRGLVPDEVEHSAKAARSGDTGLEFSWAEMLVDANRGAIIPLGPFPLPAVGGTPFRTGDTVRLLVGRERVPIPVEVTGEARFFPTAGRLNQAFLLVDLETYADYLRVVGLGGRQGPEEYWLELDGGEAREAAVATIREGIPSRAAIIDSEDVLEASRLDPLNGAGWWSLNGLGLVALVLVVLFTLVLHGTVSVRGSRVDLAVVKALGLSRRQLWLSLGVERLIVAFFGIAVGAGTGLLLARWVLDRTDITPGGFPAVPPHILTVQPWLLGLVMGLLVGLSIGSAVMAGVLAGRIKNSDTLRLGQ